MGARIHRSGESASVWGEIAPGHTGKGGFDSIGTLKPMAEVMQDAATMWAEMAPRRKPLQEASLCLLADALIITRPSLLVDGWGRILHIDGSSAGTVHISGHGRNSHRGGV